MKNYLRRLGLNRKAPLADIHDAIETALDETGDITSLKDAEIVLGDKITRAYYERTHLQYEAIYAALNCLNSDVATNTHRWPERVVEFEVETEEPLN